MTPSRFNFRAWDGERMHFASLFGRGGGVTYFSLTSEVSSDPPCHEVAAFASAAVSSETVMQSTGLTANGVEIYEGDVVRYQSAIGRVVFRDATFWVDKISGDSWMAYSFVEQVGHGDDCTVIGNIYENPELLEGR